jgi:high-affinity iron transporter
VGSGPASFCGIVHSALDSIFLSVPLIIRHYDMRCVRVRTLVALSACALVLAACSHAPSAKEGQLLYRANGCASCHGLSGHGDGPAAATLPAKPPDLGQAGLFKMGWGEMQIAQTLADGVAGSGASVPALERSNHTLVMPKFDHLTELERRSIALYVISLGTD